MKYTVYTYDRNEGEHTATLTVRSNAKMQTVFRKCAEAILEALRNDGITEPGERFTMSGSLPNIWTNGYIGCLGITSLKTKWYYPVSIQESTGAWITN